MARADRKPSPSPGDDTSTPAAGDLSPTVAVRATGSLAESGYRSVVPALWIPPGAELQLDRAAALELVARYPGDLELVEALTWR